MSTNTGVPATTKITLTYVEEKNYWIARDETRDVTAHADTREAALEALDEAVASVIADENSVAVDPEDPFFAARTFSSGQSDVSANVDEYLTADIYRDKVAYDDAS